MSTDQLSNDLASLRIDRKTKPPRTFPSWVVWVGVAAAVVAVIYFVFYPKLRAVMFKSTVETGEVTLVSPAQGQVQLTTSGYVVAQVYAKVGAKVPGRIAQIFVEEGQTIERGAKVARLEDVDFKSELASAQARAASAKARIMTARAAVAEVKVQLEREKQMVAGGLSAKSVVEDLQARLESLVASVRAAEAESAASDAETRALSIQLANYEVTSPIAGTVVDKIVEVGEVVAPGFGSPGVVEVIDLTSLVVEIDVQESRLAQVKVGSPCEIVLNAYPSQRYRGAVKEIGRRVNHAKATVPVKVAFVDRPAEVLPDMEARVSVLATAIEEKDLKQPPKLVVPTRAVVKRDGADVVFVLDDTTVRQTPVQLGGPFSGGLELLTPLPVGAKVVLSPPAKLRDGDTVKEKN